MMKNIRFILLLFSFLINVFTNAQKSKLSAVQIQDFKSKLGKNAQNMSSLQADFSQTKHLDFMENNLQSSGKLFYKSGNKVRWEYVSPFKYYLIFNHNKMFVNDGGKTQEVNASSKMLKEINQVITGAAQGKNLFDENKFQINYSKDNSFYYAVLKPKDQSIAKYIKEINLKIGDESLLVFEVKITSPSGDYTQINFKNHNKNATIADSKFSFK